MMMDPELRTQDNVCQEKFKGIKGHSPRNRLPPLPCLNYACLFSCPSIQLPQSCPAFGSISPSAPLIISTSQKVCYTFILPWYVPMMLRFRGGVSRSCDRVDCGGRAVWQHPCCANKGTSIFEFRVPFSLTLISAYRLVLIPQHGLISISSRSHLRPSTLHVIQHPSYPWSPEIQRTKLRFYRWWKDWGRRRFGASVFCNCIFSTLTYDPLWNLLFTKVFVMLQVQTFKSALYPRSVICIGYVHPSCVESLSRF